MKSKKLKQQKEEPVAKPVPVPKKPLIPQILQRPPLKSTFNPGLKLKQFGKAQFFARTRRGGI